MELLFKRCKNSLVVVPKGEIDSESAKSLRNRIDIEYDEVKARDLVFDFSHVGFMDSSGIGMIIGRYKRVTALGGKVKIFGADKTVKRIIEISGIGRLVKMYDCEKDALGKGEEI